MVMIAVKKENKEIIMNEIKEDGESMTMAYPR